MSATVERAASAPAPGRVSSPVLVGRDAELAELVQALRDPPSLALVEGEAGVGKTRLVREAMLDGPIAPGPRMVGHAHPLPEPFPIGVVVEALEEGLRGGSIRRDLDANAGALRPLLPTLAPILPPSPEPLGDPRAERHRIHRGIVSLLEATGGVLVLEDLHWADPATLELLPILVSRPPSGLSLVLTYRREDLPRGSSLPTLSRRLPSDARRVHLTLRPLDLEAVRRLVSEILGAEDVSEEFASYLFERTSGLPFALEEVLRLLQERRDVVLRDGRWTRRAVERLSVPSAVRDSILERIERLSPDGLRAVRAAAVLRDPSDERTIAAVAGLPTTRAVRAVNEALAVAMLEERGDGVAFRHILARETVEEAIPAPERRAMHLRAARRLEGAASPAVLAHHLRAAGRLREAAQRSEEAADSAAALFDDEGARRLLEQALAMTPLRSPSRGRIALKLSESAIQSLAHEEATATIRRILDEEQLPAGVRGELRFNLGRLLLQAGELDRGVEEIERAVPELRRRPALQARAMSSLAYPWTTRWRVPDHLGWLHRATATVDRQADPVARAAVYVDRAAVLLGFGEPQAWRAVLELPEGVDAPAEVARQRVRGDLNVAISALVLGHDAQAERLVDRGMASSERLGYMRAVPPLTCLRILLDWHAGRWDGLRERARESSRSEGAVPAFALLPRLVLALLDGAAGEVDAAEASLADVLGLCRRAGGFFPLATVAAALARLRLERGDEAGAGEAALPALEALATKDLWTYGAELLPAGVEVLLRSEQRDRARSFVRAAGRYLRDRDALAPVASLEEARAAIAVDAGSLRQADARYARARAIWGGLPRPLAAARALEARAACLPDASARQAALAEALDQVESLGSERDVARLRARLRELGVTFGHRRGRRGYGDRLSPRETQVLQLVRAGRTNREIAAELYLSVRTVESHVASLLRKLSVATRRELTRGEAE